MFPERKSSFFSFKQQAQKSFTLLELIAVLVILGILAAIALPTYAKVQKKTYGSVAQRTLEAVGRDAFNLMQLRGSGGLTQEDFDEALAETRPVALTAGTLAAPTRSGDYYGRDLFKVDTRDKALNLVSVYTVGADQAYMASLVPGVKDWCAWVVVSSTGSTISSRSGEATRCVAGDAGVNTPPAASNEVINLQGAGKPNSAPLTWNTVLGAESYHLYQLAPGSTKFIADVPAGAYTVNNLQNGIPHTFRVYPYSKGAEGNPSNQVTVTPLVETPGVPQNLVAKALSATTGTSSWDAVTTPAIDSAVGYRLYVGGLFSSQVNAPTLTGLLNGLSPYTQYSVQVSSFDKYGQESAPSAPVMITTFPAAPAAPNTPNITSTSVLLSWNNVLGAVSYDLYQDGVNIQTVPAPTSGAPSVSVTGLTPSSVYAFSLIARDKFNRVSKESNLRYARTPPSAPALTVTGVTETTIDVVWPAVDNAYRYLVFAGGSFVMQVYDNSATLTGLYPKTTYEIQVVAYDAYGGGSAPSSPVSATTLSAPEGLRAIGTTDTTADLTWNSVPGASSYNVFQDGVKVKNVSAAPGASQGITITGLSGGTDYAFRVTTVDRFGKDSAQSSRFTAHTYPSAPTGLVKSGSTPTTLNMSWNSASGATSYRVYVDGNLTKVTTTPSVVLSGLTRGTSYSIKVVSMDDSTYASAPSASLTVWTPPDTPTLADPFGPGSRNANVYWSGTGPSSTTTYTLKRSSSASGPFTEIANNLDGLGGYRDSSVSPGSSYFYQLTAVGPGGTSAPSNTLSINTKPDARGTVKTGATPTTISVIWSDAEDASYYRVYKDGVFQGTTNSNGFTFTGLTPNTGYSLQVSGVSPSNVEGDRGYSFIMYTTPVAPDAPTKTGATQTSLSMAWNSVPGATRYSILRDGVFAGTSDTNSFTNSSISAGTSYSYSVRAEGQGGTGPTSAASSFVTIPDTPAAPNKVTASTSSISFNWASVGSGFSYSVYRNGAFLGNTASTSWTDSGLATKTTYTYTLSASSSSGASPQGPGRAMTTN